MNKPSSSPTPGCSRFWNNFILLVRRLDWLMIVIALVAIILLTLFGLLINTGGVR